MQTILGLEALTPSGSMRYGAIGVFDGVHLGHQRIIRALVQASAADRATSMVLTFDPHPAVVVSPGEEVGLLTTFEDKASILADLGVDILLVIPFTPSFASLEPGEFVEDVIWRRAALRRVMVGYNFSFGRGGKGDAELLASMGEKYGFSVEVFPPIEVGGEIVSSTLIRGCLARGEVERAARLLGRYYSFSGEVITGDTRGTKLGVPTANLLPRRDKMLPGQGVYAVFVLYEGAVVKGVANIGYRPTFGGRKFGVEVHLLDFEGVLYGRVLDVHFVHRLRAERSFPSARELVDQIRLDISKARELLRVSPEPRFTTRGLV